MGNPSEDDEELEEHLDVENIEMGVVGEEEVAPFRVDIRDVALGLTFLELPMVNPKNVDLYKYESKAHIYIKLYRILYDHESSESEVKRWTKSHSCSSTHNHIFYLLTARAKFYKGDNKFLSFLLTQIGPPW